MSVTRGAGEGSCVCKAVANGDLVVEVRSVLFVMTGNENDRPTSTPTNSHWLGVRVL